MKAVSENKLSADARRYWEMMKGWNLNYDVDQKGASVFYVMFDSLENVVWNDELAGLPTAMTPYESTLIDGIIRDSSFQFLDNINTPEKETLEDDLIAAMEKAVPALKKAESENRLAWGLFKDTHINHLTRLAPFSRMHLNAGGGTHAINATKAGHGPSWRMIVHLTPETEAYAVYPGGQSGNPGSKYYDTFIDTWVKGEYYPLKPMRNDQQNVKAKYTMTFDK